MQLSQLWQVNLNWKIKQIRIWYSEWGLVKYKRKYSIKYIISPISAKVGVWGEFILWKLSVGLEELAIP